MEEKSQRRTPTLDEPLSLSDLEWLDEHSLVDAAAIDALYERVMKRLRREGRVPSEEDAEAGDAEDEPASDEPLSLADVEWLDEHSGVDRKAIDALYERVKERLQEEEEGSTEEPEAPDGEAEPAPDEGGEKGAGKEPPSAGETSSSSDGGSKPAPDEGPRASKEAKNLADKKGLDLAEVEGTGHKGPDGRRKIKKSDVEKKLAEREA